MSWADGTVYAFDTETTGVDVFNDRIVTASIVKFIDGHAAANRGWMINPGIEIPAEATAVHGVTNEIAQELGVDPKVGIGDLGDVVAGILGTGHRLLAFNASFDLSILDVELDRHGFDRLTARVEEQDWRRVIDPLVLARGIDKNLIHSFKDPQTGKGWVYKLPALCERYKVKFTESHEAHADATGCALLAFAIAKKYPQVADYGPAHLHNLQRTWHRSNQDSLRAYFDKNHIEHDGCDGGFPLHSRLQLEVAR